jgi:hypothetical protein
MKPVATMDDVGVPDAAWRDPQGLLWSLDGPSGSMAKIDPKTRKVLLRFPLQIEPGAPAWGAASFWMGDYSARRRGSAGRRRAEAPALPSGWTAEPPAPGIPGVHANAGDVVGFPRPVRDTGRMPELPGNGEPAAARAGGRRDRVDLAALCLRSKS